MSELDQVKEWIAKHRSTLDKVIAEAALSFYEDHKDRPNFDYDFNKANEELYNLSRGKDLCYDRYTTGLAYSLWYQGRRTHLFLNYFLPSLIDSKGHQESIEIFDLGAGTGAVQMAAGLGYSALKGSGLEAPEIKVINIDSSSIMLDYLNEYLWPAFKRHFKHAHEIACEMEVNSWNNPNDMEFTNPWFVGSYLFDHSENQEVLKDDFIGRVKELKPGKVFLITSNQQNKKALVDAVKGDLNQAGFEEESVSTEGIFNGSLNECQEVRKQLLGENSRHLKRTPQWTERSFYGVTLNNRNQELGLGFTRNSEGYSNFELFNPQIKVRRDIRLNEEQARAAKNDERPTSITGPAGCGKSVVITERVKNICEDWNYDDRLQILVTTFNKFLMSFLGGWLEDILDERKFDRKGNLFYFKDSNSPNISLMHFDVLPTRLGERKNKRIVEENFKYINKSIEYVKNAQGITTNDHDKVLNPQYIYDEYQRVVYGLRLEKEEDYLSGLRKGRPRLQKNGLKRKLVWKTIKEYLKHLEEEGLESFITRRHKFLKWLESADENKTYTHILVDEFQDCTQADFEIFFKLLNDPNRLVIAGDYAQAVHLGSSADIPRKDRSEMRNWNHLQLEGSFRLPFRISECIRPISEHIKNVSHEESSVITPFKGSPPGARPLMVYGHSTDELSEKILNVIDAYNSLDVVDISSEQEKRINILEKDLELSNSLNKKRPGICKTETILKLKGIEKECIIWSTESSIENQDEVYNFVYTILTRTSGLLIIALDDSVQYDYKHILKQMRSDRLITWDEETEEKYQNLF